MNGCSLCLDPGPGGASPRRGLLWGNAVAVATRDAGRLEGPLRLAERTMRFWVPLLSAMPAAAGFTPRNGLGWPRGARGGEEGCASGEVAATDGRSRFSLGLPLFG